MYLHNLFNVKKILVKTNISTLLHSILFKQATCDTVFFNYKY
jgi:hypothetical protein